MQRIKKGMISSLPRSISKDSTKVENQEYPAKLPNGVISPRAGPMLLKQLSIAVRLVSTDIPSIEMRRKLISETAV